MILELMYKSASPHEAHLSGRRDTLARKTAELACVRVLGLNYPGFVGIVGESAKGEDYPELWTESNGRLRPHMFSSSVPNSVIGHCSVALGMRGPQIVLTDSDIDARLVAEAQLFTERADAMIVLRTSTTSPEVTAVLFRRAVHV